MALSFERQKDTVPDPANGCEHIVGSSQPYGLCPQEVQALLRDNIGVRTCQQHNSKCKAQKQPCAPAAYLPGTVIFYYFNLLEVKLGILNKADIRPYHYCHSLQTFRLHLVLTDCLLTQVHCRETVIDSALWVRLQGLTPHNCRVKCILPVLQLSKWSLGR